jgi:hypothetical protein
MTGEIEENMVQLLAGVAFPDDKFSPTVVITSDYRLWLSQFPREQMTLLDISLLAPPEPGRARLLESAGAAYVPLFGMRAISALRDPRFLPDLKAWIGRPALHMLASVGRG